MIEFNERNIRTWSMLGPSGVLGLAACEIAARNDKFVTVTADLCYFSGLDRYQNLYPDKLINVGIAEQNMLGVAGGLVKEGMNVFATTYASFASTRVLDQVKVNMGYMKLPIKLIGLTSGYSVGILGATHMSIEDISIMRSIPNMVILSPADCTETMKILLAASEIEEPVYIRMSGASRAPIVYNDDYDFEIGKASKLRCGKDVSLMATGTMVHSALLVADKLETVGISCEVLNFHTIKPIDKEAVYNAATGKKAIVTIEEHNVIGGLGTAVAEVIAPVKEKSPQLILGIEDQYLHAASYEYLIENSGLTVQQIYEKILLFLNKGE